MIHRASLLFSALSVGLALGCLGGCAGRASSTRAFVGQRFHLCSNMRFNRSHDATDANYAYASDGVTLPLGTPVTVTAVGGHTIEWTAEGSARPFTLRLAYGRDTLTADDYFARVLCTADPRPTLRDLPPELRRAIEHGDVAPGMTRAQVIMARGYPPLHSTESYDADRWFFFQTGSIGDFVTFDRDRVSEVRTGWAPQ